MNEYTEDEKLFREAIRAMKKMNAAGLEFPAHCRAIPKRANAIMDKIDTLFDKLMDEMGLEYVDTMKGMTLGKNDEYQYILEHGHRPRKVKP